MANLTFSLMLQPSFYKKAVSLPDTSQLLHTVTVDILSSEVKEPEIIELFWSDEKEIHFGKPASKRTKPLQKNETVFLHIHTRGLYGKQVVCETNDDFTRNITVRDNVACEAYTFFEDFSREIVVCCRQERGKIEKEASIQYKAEVSQSSLLRLTQVYAYPDKYLKDYYAGEAKCRVDFRPTKEYDGSFGFSWYRIGDMNQKTGYDENPSEEYDRTSQHVKVNLPCNDHPFCEEDFSGEGIMGKHWETTVDFSLKHFLGEVDVPVINPNNSGLKCEKNMYFKNLNKFKPVRDNFVPDNRMAKRHKYDYLKISLENMMLPPNIPPLTTEYLTPVMTIVEDKEVELQLFLRVLKSPKQILFAFDNPLVETDGIMTLTISKKPAEINDPPVTNNLDIPNHDYKLTVKCNKPFNKAILLKAYAIAEVDGKKMAEKKNGRGRPKVIPGKPLVLPELCGMVQILPNDDAHWRTIDVVFYNVITNLDANKEPILGIKGTEEESLKKFLQQAYVKLKNDIKKEDIDLSGDTEYSDMCIDAKKNDNIKDTFDSTETNISGLVNLLKKKAKAKKNYDPNRYKIFFIPDIASSVVGFSDNNEKRFAVCFSDASKNDLIHELGHALDLPHSFNGHSPKAHYTYEDGKTDNIMDYSDLIGGKCQSFYYWQWKALNTLI